MDIIELLLFGFIGALIGTILGNLSRLTFKMGFFNKLLLKLIGLFVLLAGLFAYNL